jgi:hypothetical protein
LELSIFQKYWKICDKIMTMGPSVFRDKKDQQVCYRLPNTHLFFGNSHIVLDITENSWLNEVALVPNSLAASAQLSTFLLATVNQIYDLAKLFIINLQIGKHPND